MMMMMRKYSQDTTDSSINTETYLQLSQIQDHTSTSTRRIILYTLAQPQ